MQYEQESLRRLQLAQLDVLKHVDRVCREHDITYFLDSGTMLGAVRHGGFIPWDDDVDVGMLRCEYERFLDVAPAALGDGYVVSDPRSCAENAGMFAKVWKRGTKFFTDETIEAGIEQGIFIDVFPYDALHADPVIATKQRRMCRLWQSVSYLYHSRHINVPHGGVLGVLERGGCVVAHVGVQAIFNHERIFGSFTSWALRGSDAPNGTFLCMAYMADSAHLERTLVPTEDIDFEGASFPGPGNAKAYLDSMYGPDWGELPPLEARRNHAPVMLDFGD